MKHPDYYHTVYSLAGMSISQYASDYESLHAPDSNKSENFDGNYNDPLYKTILLAGEGNNKLRRINPVFNVRYDFLARAKAYFRDKTKKEVSGIK